MNRRLQRELGYDATEKLGHKCILTDFMIENWGENRRLKESISPEDIGVGCRFIREKRKKGK